MKVVFNTPDARAAHPASGEDSTANMKIIIVFRAPSALVPVQP
jgi:hypothetical protein